MQLKRLKKVAGKIDILNLGDAALLLDFRESVDPLSGIHQLCALLFSASPRWLKDTIPGMDSLLISLHFENTDYQATRAAARAQIEVLLESLHKDKKVTIENEIVHRVRVCYDPELAPDLLASAEKCKLPLREFINRHKNSEIRVDILGFMPGFPYCSGLDPSLRLPRLESPRTAVRTAVLGDSRRGNLKLGSRPLQYGNPGMNPKISTRISEFLCRLINSRNGSLHFSALANKSGANSGS